MSDLQPFNLTATAISQKVRGGEWSVREVANFYIERTERYSRGLNTQLFWDPADVLAQAKVQEARLRAKEDLPLAGVPVLIKDNICTRAIPTTCASKMLTGFRPPYDATVVARLRQAGAIIFGKSNCDEFAMGSSNEHSAFGPVLNPWNRDFVPGGSSGGSAAAVAADLVPVALGSDTGGSIRQPASFCGITGLKPTYGRVSRYGLVAYSSSLDQIGPMARSTQDLALLLDVLSGHDPMDATSRVDPYPSVTSQLDAPGALKGLRLGLVREFFGPGLADGTRAALLAAVKLLQEHGASVEEVSLPTLSHSISSYYLIAAAEASANLARFDGIRYGHRTTRSGLSLKQLVKASRSEGFGREVKQRIMLGTFALSAGYYDAYYAKAKAGRSLIAADFAKAFGQVDVLVAPNAPSVAFRLGEKNQDPLAMYLGDICTLGVNLAGLPALSVPCGFDLTGLPIGLQLIAPAWEDGRILRTAHAYEQLCPWTKQAQPPL